MLFLVSQEGVRGGAVSSRRAAEQRTKSQSQNTHHKSLFSYVVIFLVDVLSWLEGSLAHSLFDATLRAFQQYSRGPLQSVLHVLESLGYQTFIQQGCCCCQSTRARAYRRELRRRTAAAAVSRSEYIGWRARLHTYKLKGALLHAFAIRTNVVANTSQYFSPYWPAPSYSSSQALKGRGAKVKHLAGLPESASFGSRGIFHSLTYSSTKVQKQEWIHIRND